MISWRLFLWLAACVLVWAFAHDYVASHINHRIDAQQMQVQKGDLNFLWNPASPKDVVTIFDTEVASTGFRGKQVALSMTMPDWPLDTRLYGQFSLRFKVSKTAQVVVALETSDAQTSNSEALSVGAESKNAKPVFYFTAKKAVQAGMEVHTHEIKLDELEWLTEGGKSQEWQELDKARTWVVRLFAKEVLDWEIESMTISQTRLPLAVEWQVAGCMDLPVGGFVQSDCMSSNRMVQIDHEINQQSIYQTVKFNVWLPIQAWQQGLMVIVLLLLASIKRARIQIALLVVLGALALMLYVPINDFLGGQIADSVWLNGLLALLMVWFVFVKNRFWWLASQKGSLKLWLFVLFVAVLLWWQSQFSLSFLTLLPAYLLWAGFQQTLMVSLFEWLSRSKAREKGSASLLLVFVAWCFGLIHMPNHYLMFLTFVGGLFWVYVWCKYQNLLLMVVSHCLWALLLYQAVGDVWLHSARVGFAFL